MSLILTLQDTVSPAFEIHNNLVVFATDDAYTPYCGVAIASLMANASPSQNYDIVILEETLHSDNKYLLAQLAQEKENISIRFFNLRERIAEHKDLLYISGHVSVAAYYRFFITKIFPLYDKALYLDCDLVIDSDVAELIIMDFQKNLIMAVPDTFLLRQHVYLKDFLQLHDTTQYFNSGVILFNIVELRKQAFLENCFTILQEKKELRWHDQDVFNILFQGKTRFISPKWNYLASLKALGGLFGKIPSTLHQALLDLEQDIKESPCIIHYAGSKKPWYSLQFPLSDTFWHYAKSTSFYDGLVEKALEGIPKALGKARQKSWIYGLGSVFALGKLRKKFKAKKRYYDKTILITEQFSRENSTKVYR